MKLRARSTAGFRLAAATAAVAACGWTSAAGAQEALRSFDIPAQDASSALVQLCLEADCEVVLVGRPEAGVRTRPVRGRMGWRTALRRMLAGTGLQHRFVGARGLRVWSAPPPPSTVQRAAPPAVDTTVTEVEPVVVVGRLSDQIDESLRRKRQADVIADFASAQRIGELPAANLAEALQRVPGVAIEREVGEGQFVSVRGLGPLFQSVTLNGVPVAFNENIRNSTQSGRQFRFRALSADLLAGARLTKSPTPDLIDGGIGSNIDIETVGGLDGDRFVSVRAGAAIETRTGRGAPDVALAGRWLSADARWGMVGGLSQEGRSVLYDRFQIQRYRDLELDGRTVSAPNDVRTTLEREERRRRSAFFGADWRVGPGLSLDVDALVSTFDNSIREDRLVYGLGERLLQPGAVARVREGVITAGEITQGQIDNNTEFSDQDHLNLAVAVGAEARLGGWRLSPRISVSSARSVLDTPLERISARSPAGIAYAFDLGDAANSRKAARLTTAFDVLDPQALRFQKLGVRAVESVDEDHTARTDARRRLDAELGPARLTAIQFGAQYSDRSRDYQRRDREAAPRPGATVTAEFYGAVTRDDAFRALIVDGGGPWAAAEFQRFRAAMIIPGEADGVIVRPDELTPTGMDLQNSYRVGERVAAAYARIDFDGLAGATPFFGNAGLRLVDTRTEVDGSILGVSPTGTVEVRPAAHSGEHRVLLPSANVAVEITQRQLLRLAASRSLTRPSLADLRSATVPASTLVSAIYDRGQAEIDDPSPGSIFTGIGGNPALEPYVSTNLDLSWELTLPRTALSLALFHKRIDDFILTVEAPEELAFETRFGPPVTAVVVMSRPRNAGRATVHGLEAGFHHRLASGLGLWASATWTDAGAVEIASGARRDLTGVSDLAWSVNPFVERGPFSASLSWSWRSAFRSEADMQGGGVSDFIVAPAGYLDAQATYEIGRGAQLVLTASNLTDTVDLSYEGVRSRVLQLGRAGRAFGLALRWTM